MNFDPLRYRWGSRRNVVYARGGMACTNSPLASRIGCKVMEEGGNAIDAACAISAALPILEPTSNGIGSDGFMLIWTGGKLYGLNGSGYSPKALSADRVREMGYSVMPKEGWLPTMVPGAMAAMAEARRRFGTLPLERLMAPAIHYAREGFPVPVNMALQLRGETARLNAAYEKNPLVFGTARALFTKDGHPYQAGELLRQPEAAATLEELAHTDCESLYRGALAEKIVAWSEQSGGYFTKADFAAYHPRWVEPITVNYKGYDVFEMPPNGHGITVLMALNLLKGFDLPADRMSPETLHLMMECLKLAFVDAKTFVADPRTMQTKVEDLLSDHYADRRRALIGREALFPTAGDPRCGDTVYFCTADGQGNMVSWIQSNYTQLGSLVAIPGTGIHLQNRGANFSLDPASDNCLAGGKQSYHTIIPGFLAKNGQPIGPFGVMGGFMQPQGHLQVLVNTIDYGMNPQEALDCPRFQWVGGKTIQLEQEFPSATALELSRRGHEISLVHDRISMGRGQIIWRAEDGTLCGGTEPRSDGAICCF